jgi:hypothetical protein
VHVAFLIVQARMERSKIPVYDPIGAIANEAKPSRKTANAIITLSVLCWQFMFIAFISQSEIGWRITVADLTY